MSRLARLALSLAVVAWFAVGCGDDAPPPNETPQITAASTTCAMSSNADITGEVLTGGEITTLDENLVSVTVDIPGLERMYLAGSALAEDADPLETPQTWAFTVAAEDQILCAGLAITVEAIDEKGARTQQILTP